MIMHLPGIVWIFCIGILGAILGKYSRIAGGSMLGSSFAVTMACNFTELPQDGITEFMFITQLIIGCMLGQSINRRFWSEILTIWQPTLMYVGLFTLVALPFAAGLVFFCDFDGLTAVLASTPARMQDMIIMAETADRDTVTVMLQQLLRQLSIIAMTPLVMARLARREKKAEGGDAAAPQAMAQKEKFPRTSIQSVLILTVPAVLGGIGGGMFSSHPVGPMLGALLAVAVSRLVWSHAGTIPFPAGMSFLVQCCAGLLLGIRITPDTGPLVITRLLPLTFSLLYILGASLALAAMLQRYYNWSPALSWLAAAPARTADMLAISYDLPMTGHERLALVTVHTIRQLYFTLLASTILLFF